MKILVRYTVRTGYTKSAQHNIDVYQSSGLQILKSFFWIPDTKVDFHIVSKYTYFKWVEVE